MSTKRPIALDWGREPPLAIDRAPDALVGDFQGPSGVRGDSATSMVHEALAKPVDVPALARHVVAGDRVAIAVSGVVVEEEAVVAAVIEALAEGGVAKGDVTLLRSADFAAADDAHTGYLAADVAADPIYLARELIDADAVVAIGEWNWDASLRGRSIEGELWPAFSRRSSRESLLKALVARPKAALKGWRNELEQVTWQLGLLASLRIVPGANGTLAAAAFGSPPGSRRACRHFAEAWRPTARDAAELSIASLHVPGLEGLVRGVAAAARITQPEGTVCVAAPLAEPPGPVFTRWRQGAPLVPLLREAVGSGDAELLADAFLTSRFRRALGTRRLVLLSGIDQETVEDLGFGHAPSPETIERLAKRAATVAVLREADRLLPSIGS